MPTTNNTDTIASRSPNTSGGDPMSVDVDRETERFLSDLQDHIEDVSTFYISTDELREVCKRLVDDGHVTLPDSGAAAGRRS